MRSQGGSVVASMWWAVVASWVGSGREQAVLGETGGDVGDLPPLPALSRSRCRLVSL